LAAQDGREVEDGVDAGSDERGRERRIGNVSGVPLDPWIVVSRRSDVGCDDA